MNGSKWLKAGVASAALAFFGVFSAQAVPLAPGGVVAVGAGTETGVLIADTGPQAFQAESPPGTIKEAGTARVRVFRQAGGTLDFVYDFFNNAAGTPAGNAGNGIKRATGSDFSGTTITDVAFIAGTAILGPTGATSVPVTADETVVGGVVGFNFNAATGVAAGFAADTLIIRTTATNFVVGSYTLIDGASANLQGFMFAPAASVPLPKTALLGLLGLPAIGWSLRRKKLGLLA